jgi:hypothetical protein
MRVSCGTDVVNYDETETEYALRLERAFRITAASFLREAIKSGSWKDVDNVTSVLERGPAPRNPLQDPRKGDKFRKGGEERVVVSRRISLVEFNRHGPDDPPDHWWREVASMPVEGEPQSAFPLWSEWAAGAEVQGAGS